MEAKTIHRLLEYNPQEGCNRNADNPLEGDVLIVDECSMIDLMLMYFLVKAIPPHMRLVMVGDTDQLPSVGAATCCVTSSFPTWCLSFASPAFSGRRSPVEL